MCFLPLHIFEPRYREMVADALDGDRMIGMVLLRPGWEADYEGRPPVFPSAARGSSPITNGCPTAATTSSCAGLQKFRIRGEDDSRSYRVAHIDKIDEPVAGRARRTKSGPARRKLEALLVPQPSGRGHDPKVPPSMSDEDLINALAQYMELEPLEKQALLERDGLLARCRSLIELLEIKMLVTKALIWKALRRLNC